MASKLCCVKPVAHPKHKFSVLSNQITRMMLQVQLPSLVGRSLMGWAGVGVAAGAPTEGVQEKSGLEI